MEDCKYSAPAGSKGRLAFIPNQDIFNLFNSYIVSSNEPFYIGMEAHVAVSVPNFDKNMWTWTEYIPGGVIVSNVAWIGRVHYNTNSNQMCMGIKGDFFTNFQCDAKHPAICEYYRGTVFA